MKSRYLFLLLCVGQTGWVQAEIYKYVDPDGHVTYSSTPMKGAIKLELNSPNTSLAPARSGTHPSEFPRVDGQTQKSRDDTRRKILQDELASEQKLLDEARQKLQLVQDTPEIYRGQDGKTYRNVAKYEANVKSAQDEVSLHEKNIEALNTELSNLK